MRVFLPISLAAWALAGCAEDARKAADPLADDPAITAALADEIMIDPDLVGQNDGNAAVVVAGPASAPIPPPPFGREVAAAARAEAVRLAGGALRTAPDPIDAKRPAWLKDAMTAAQVAGAASADCAAKVSYTAGWAAQLPETFAVYPRGAVEEAAGTRDGCRLRVVHFVTPVDAGEVIDYYYTRATAAGYSGAHTRDEAARVLQGGKAGAAYLVHARPGAQGLTDVDLVVSGG